MIELHQVRGHELETDLAVSMYGEQAHTSPDIGLIRSNNRVDNYDDPLFYTTPTLSTFYLLEIACMGVVWYSLVLPLF